MHFSANDTLRAICFRYFLLKYHCLGMEYLWNGISSQYSIENQPSIGRKFVSSRGCNNFSPRNTVLHDDYFGYSGYFRSFWGSSEEYMIRLYTRLRLLNDLHLRPRVESIKEEYATMIGASAFTVRSSSTFATSIIIVLLVLKYLNIPLYAQCLFGCMRRKV